MPRPELSPQRANVLGVGVHAIDMDVALTVLQEALENERKGYVCVTGVHGVMEAQSDEHFRNILNASLLTVPDGMPMVWVGRLQGFRNMRRVYGPDLMLRICEASVQTGHTHFLYGGRPGVAEELRSALVARFPGLRIVGTYTPPFRQLFPDEEQGLREQVAALRPDYFWVGLSTPKQERFIAEYGATLHAKIMLGVGAAFDIHTGHVKDAPAWLKQTGLQWLHRLMQEPRRLGRRYAVNNPAFVLKIVRQLLGVERSSLPTSRSTA